MKKALSVLSVLALCGLGFAGCGGSEGDACTSNLDCDVLAGLSCNVATGLCEADSTIKYKPVDNEEYCKGTCDAGENCFLDPEDEDQGYCSTCLVECEAWNPSYPVCNEATGRCMASASCGAGMVASPNPDGYSASCVNESVNDNCETEGDCEQGYTCDLIEHKCVVSTVVGDQYKYVRIDDMSEKSCDGGTIGSDGLCSLDDPGADIDAVALKKTGKDTTYAKGIRGYLRGDGLTQTQAEAKGNTGAWNPSKALNAPDSFLKYGQADFDGVCEYYTDADKTIKPFVSLGGEGGYIILEMSEKIEAGDTIDVLEVGKCTLHNTTSSSTLVAMADRIIVQVSVNSTDGWKLVGEGIADDTNKGIISFNVTADMVN